MINCHDSFCPNWCISRHVIDVFNTFSHQPNTISRHLLVTFNDTLENMVLEEFIHEAAAVQWYVHSSQSMCKRRHGWEGYSWIRLGWTIPSTRRGSRWFQSEDVCVNGRVWAVWSAIASQRTDGPAGLWLGTEWECRCHRTDIDVFAHFRALPTHGQPNGSVDVSSGL